jgi:hypothetical protein
VIDFVHAVRMEDVPLCENVQRGLHSKGYERGRLVIDAGHTDLSEHAVHHFQQKIAQLIGENTDDK